jgi:hypothetical protein
VKAAPVYHAARWLGGVTVWPLAARVRSRGQAADRRLFGQNLGESERAAACAQRLRELGGVEVALAIEYRWAEGRNERKAIAERRELMAFIREARKFSKLSITERSPSSAPNRPLEGLSRRDRSSTTAE